MMAPPPGGVDPGDDIRHCIAKIAEIIDRGEDSRRSLLQLGYNLGRLSELTGMGREPFWDRWKQPVAAWDRSTLAGLVEELTRLNERGST